MDDGVTFEYAEGSNRRFAPAILPMDGSKTEYPLGYKAAVTLKICQGSAGVEVSCPRTL